MFQAYSDESGINNEDLYTSVSVVSGEVTELKNLRDSLVKILNDEKVREVHFQEITGYKKPVAKAARFFIKTAVNDFAALKQIRIDTLTVDNKYIRSVFPDYDMEQKFEHMYHCLLSHIGRMWNNLNWNFYPDTNSKVNWYNITSFINKTKLNKNIGKKPLLVKMMEENPLFNFNEVKQLVSVDEPLVQLSDLFAGLARFSHEEKVDCSNIVINKKGAWQSELKLEDRIKIEIVPKKKQCRYEVIKELYDLCHKHRLYVSMKENKHLWARKHYSPINFWDYQKPPNKITLTTG
jgi:hypothetical protein